MIENIFDLDIKFIAHRGLNLLETENTMAAFRKATHYPFYGIECDVHLTLDDIPVVFHDDDLKRLAGKDLMISKMRYDEIKNIRLFNKGTNSVNPNYYIPTLDEFLTLCKNANLQAIIELKSPFKPKELELIISIVDKHDMLNNVTFISFYIDNLRHVRLKLKEVKLQLLVGEYLPVILDICKAYRFDISIHHNHVTKALVKRFNQNGLEVATWTVNSIDRIKDLSNMGVQYITTDGV